MKKALVFIAVAAASIQASAGIPVIDGVQNARGIAEFITTTAHYAAEIKQLETQVEEMKGANDRLTRSFNAANGARGMGGIGASDQAYLPETWEGTQDLMSVGGAIGDRAQEYREAAKIVDSEQLGLDENSHAAKLLKAQQNQIALNLAVNEKTYSAASKRIQQLKIYVDEINNSDDEKKTQDLQAAIAAEQNMLANEKTKLDDLARLQQGQRDVLDQQSREISLKAAVKPQPSGW
ncbi:type IV secretion system protein [Metapseudomonas otitidis]|uniref:type IV secretion system protein n=1 Tax=Metapseudomonas otitidis TaxID=319939 RepID=UPI000D1BFFEB|nr:type IV secretion system protein [Pseudomonas otitidis]